MSKTIELTEVTTRGDIKRRIKRRFVLAYHESGTGLTALCVKNRRKGDMWVSVRESVDEIDKLLGVKNREDS